MDYARNLGILTQAELEKLQATQLVILGAGLGSLIAELALRSGFTRIRIIDGDTVAASNLNRQLFCEADIGQSKVETLRERLLAIHPGAQIDARHAFLQPGNTVALLSEASLIVDSIDLSGIEAILAAHAWARRQGVPVVFPMNLIWKSMVAVFDRGSASVEELLGVGDEAHAQVSARDFGFWAAFLGKHVSDEHREGYQAFVERSSRMKDWCPAPQLGITATATASLTVSCLIKLVLGVRVALAPDVISVDLFEVSRPRPIEP